MAEGTGTGADWCRRRSASDQPGAIMTSGPPNMRAIELLGDIDEQHQLRASVPEELPSGPVRMTVRVPDEDAAGAAWQADLSRKWQRICETHGRTSTHLTSTHLMTGSQ